jgi:hypothetical protein
MKLFFGSGVLLVAGASSAYVQEGVYVVVTKVSLSFLPYIESDSALILIECFFHDVNFFAARICSEEFLVLGFTKDPVDSFARCGRCEAVIAFPATNRHLDCSKTFVLPFMRYSLT